MDAERYVIKHQPHKTRPRRGEWVIGDRWSMAVLWRYRTRADAEEGMRMLEETGRAVREAMRAVGL